MTEQTSALKSKENNNMASKQPKPPMQKAAPGTTKRIFGYIFQYKWRVALVVVCILVGAAAQAGSSLFLQSLIDTYILPMVGATNPDWMPLLRALTLMACLYAAGIFCSWLWQWIIVAVEQGTLKKIRDDMFAHQQTLPIRYFDTNEHGDIMSRYTNDTDTLRQAISQSFPQMFSSAVSALAALVSMLWLSVPVTIFCARIHRNSVRGGAQGRFPFRTLLRQAADRHRRCERIRGRSGQRPEGHQGLQP
ncbi:ABC transporter, permease/ATP-binding protein [Bifidobacterium pseudocatenulatum DSM 20438 = JCM 1200 = LMG 10505]|uniref:ABC transporter, permease/ATP-binding protein n=1 Tax=Bifidobacterium pseudocatenulatum DSM 20438 = JCM 1200 = LMG 10505 TaxID=547043 RepID=C0BSK6_BIFPS|nr:ABC transporter, permease/ATP-binding protein [Bifidobacterium pseudocatenulatum DSM 20438 = JCM 1200 = LMG 10505]